MTDRRTGSVGLNVDIVPTVDRRVGSVGLNVDLIPAIEVGVSTSQAQAVSVDLIVELTVETSQAHSATVSLEVISGGAELDVATTQAQAVALEQAVDLHVGLTQATQASVFQQLVLSVMVAAEQAQAVTSTLSRGYQQVVAATQATAVACQRLILLTRKLAGQGVRTRVERRPGTAIQPTVAITARTQVRLIRQVQLARALSQPQTTSTTLVHVDVMQTVTTTQAQSLALQRDVTLARSVTQAQAADLPRGLELIQTLLQPTTLILGRAIDLVRSLVVGSSAALESEDVTVRYELVVSVTQAQAVALGTSTTGAPAKHFVIAGRDVSFVASGRSSRFATTGRRVRFTVEVR